MIVEKYTIAVDPGIVINPVQLKRQVESGAVMGMSHALHEEMTFDESGITSRDWRSYPILTMGEVPEINVVIMNRPGSRDLRWWFRGGECVGRASNLRGVLRRDRQSGPSATAQAGVRAGVPESVTRKRFGGAALSPLYHFRGPRTNVGHPPVSAPHPSVVPPAIPP